MRILITGISGFIGQHLSEALVADGHEVHGVYEHADSRGKNPCVEDERKHVVNLTAHEQVEGLVGAVRPDAVLHLASRSEVALSFRNYIEVTEVNYLAVVNLAEACRQFAPDLRAFVMASTMETYGNAQPITGETAFTEETRQYPMAPYAVAKLACEKYLEYMGYAYDFPFVTLRQTNTYGRRDNAFFIVERILSQMVQGETVNLGAGWPVRNFLWIDDLVQFYRAVLHDVAGDRRAIGETFVTGPDRPVTIEQLAGLCATAAGWEGQVNWDTIPPRAAEVPYLNSDPAKAGKVLGWQPEVGLEEGLDLTAAIWRAGAVDDRQRWA